MTNSPDPADGSFSTANTTDQTSEANDVPKKGWIKTEDWLAVILGSIVLLVALAATAANPVKDYADHLARIDQQGKSIKELEQSLPKPRSKEDQEKVKKESKALEKLRSSLFTNPLKPYFADLGEWDQNPADAFLNKEKKSIAMGVLGTLVFTLILFSLGTFLRGESVAKFALAFIAVFLLAIIAYLLAGQKVIKYYNLEYAIWALLVGMLISNTIGTPGFLKPAMCTELFIKTGLVFLGSEILLSRLLVLGLPGIFVSWVCTPITFIATYLFGQYVLKMESKSLNLVISADMSVCGVSAAIATGAACRAKKEEISLAIGISLAFTAIMMVVMPGIIRAVHMNEVVGGAWLGGTIDSTGAVAAAGGMLSLTALEVATTVKMIQNILIGVVAFTVAVYWVMYEERDANAKRPNAMEIWYRFPKFIFGFVGASIVFSAIYYYYGTEGSCLTEAVTSGTGKVLRGWLFCLAFVSIGLETNFRELAHYMKGGKPLILYVCGQTLNLLLTLLMAWIMFVHVFPQSLDALAK